MDDEADIRQPEGQGKSKRRSRRWQRIVLAASLAVVLILVAASAWLITHHHSWPDPKLVSAARSTSYPIYYPGQLPKGFSAKVSSITDSGSVFIYALQYDDGKKVFVSAIPKPIGVKFDDFYNRILSNKQNVLNTSGTAVIGTANDQPIGSLVTDKTWVTVNAPKGLDTDRLRTLVATLKQF